jgi:tRNA nucleotidyltransferase (CCA-adding enzyme)
MKLTLSSGAAVLLDALHAAGYAAYAVGGCVRDGLLGLCPHDWDLCTSALPQQVMNLFGEERCIPTGLQHGTVTVKQGGGLYEITTFRTEGTYSDGRHPDEVHFVPDVREDLARRDFTINAMAYNEKEGLIDPFGGQNDLQQGIVRAVGVPHQRFTEDALRILRLYRFAARYGFAIDPATGQAAEALCTHLDCVSAERIEEELSKLLAAPAPAAYLDGKILTVILPELAPEALDAAKPAVDACPAGSENLPVRLAALLLSLGEDGTRKVLRRLRCSNALIEETAVLVRESGGSSGSFLLGHESGHSIARPTACGGRVPPQRTVLGETSAAPDTAAIRKLLGRYGLTTVQRLAALGTALHPERAADFAAQARSAEQMEADGVCCRISQLAVNGRDLMAAGIPAGPGLRRVLEALLDGVIRGEYPNEKQALLEQAHKISAS